MEKFSLSTSLRKANIVARLGNRTSAKAAPTKWHDKTCWRYAAGIVDGQPLLQIETARKADIGFSGEFAQVIQIDKAHAVEMVELLRRTFALNE